MIVGRTLELLGLTLLTIAAFFALAALVPSGGWDFFAGLYLPASEISGASGISALLLGIYFVRTAQSERKFREEMERNNRSLRGSVFDRTGTPVPEATVDIFTSSEAKCPIATTQTDDDGRFSVELPDGEYVLSISVPEVGETALPVTVSHYDRNEEMQIRFETVAFN